jgi:signal transduction histidine kinase
MISDTTKSLASLVEDVLQVARIESGEFHVENAPFDIADLAERVRTEQTTANPEREIVVEVGAGTPTMVLGDRERVWQVLTNLVTNALKFSPPDKPVEIGIALASGQEGVVATAIRDHGMGIRPEDQERLFRKFSRISPPDGAPKVKGTGLGLFICKSIVEAIGGAIEVESAPGAGSIFRFTVPVALVREEATN